MTISDILKLQDKDGDLLIDVCNEVVSVPESFKCPDCVKNPYASVPNWKDLDIDSAFFNEKECKYQVSVVTRYTSTMDYSILQKTEVTEEEAAEGTNARFEEYAVAALESILAENNKEISENSRILLLPKLEYEQFYLDSRPNSRLTLLYSIPFADLQSVPDDTGGESSDDEDEEDNISTGGSISMTINAADIKPKIIRVRKALRLYSKYLTAFRALESGNILIEDSNAVFNLHNYGDSGKFSKSTLGSIANEIDSFLSARGFNIVGLGGGGLFQEQVDKLKFEFDSKYKLKTIQVFTIGCGEESIIYGSKKVKSLSKKEAFRDPTAVAYFVNLNEMDAELQSREGPDWKEFIVKHTFPPVYHTVQAVQPQPNSRSCINATLAKESKQLGQDLLDSTFSIGDAIVAKFKQNNCLNEVDELEEEDVDLGLQVTPDVDRANKTILEMATEQAFATMEDEDQIFSSLCAGILDSAGMTNGFSSFSLEDIWTEGLDKIKLCGMFELLIETSNCLMKGLTFEEAASSIVKSALKGMSMENLTDFFTQTLPPNAAREIQLLAERKLQNGEVFPEGGLAEEISRTANQESLQAYSLNPFNETSDIPEENETPQDLSEGNQTTPSSNRTQDTSITSTPQQTDRKTLLSNVKFTQSEAGLNTTLNKNVLIEAYILALVDYYSGEMILVLNMLNKYPGARLIAKAIKFMDCPQDPVIEPSIPDFMQSLRLVDCSTPFNIVSPKIQNPFGWIPEIFDFPKILFDLLKAGMVELILKIIIQMLSKICKLLGSALCTGLGAVTSLGANAIAGDNSGFGGRDEFKNIIRNTICGDDADENQINDTINDLFEKLGFNPEALANQERVDQFVGDISSSTTQSEFMSAMLGNPSAEFLQIIDQLIEFEYSDFRGNVSNKQSIEDFFNNIGNLMPVDLRDAMADQLEQEPISNLPANPSLCATEEDLEDFCQRRASLLSGRATPDQAALMCEQDRDRLRASLDEINDLVHLGVPNALALPDIVSDPGCNNGLIPFETEDMMNSSMDVIDNEMKRIKLAYTTDFIGNGPGQSRWGMINMIMSDTLGNPLTAHHRKNFFQNRYVDFYIDGASDNDGRVPMIQRQRGAYPSKVAEWLQYQINDSFNDLGWATTSDLHESLNFVSNNSIGEKEVSLVDFSTMGLTSGLYDTPQVNLWELPDLGLFSTTSIKWESKKIKLVRKARKSTPDMKLIFKDNAKGYRYGENSSNSAYSYGFDISVFISDLYTTRNIPGDNQLAATPATVNRPKDNIRLLIEKKFNPGAKIVSPNASNVVDDGLKNPFGSDNDESKVVTERYDEIYFEDTTIDDIQDENYPKFNECFRQKSDYIPQVVLLRELITNKNAEIELDEVKSFYDSLMNDLMKEILFEVGDNEAAFTYGAEYDNLSEDDVEYVLGPGFRDSGMPYGEAEIESEDEDGNTIYRNIIKDDSILGMSRMQYQIENEGRDDTNRVFYLDPNTFGGTYMNPAVYISPLKNEGWMGMIDVLFPEITHCKDNKKVDLVNFSEISEIVNDRLPKIPHDDRLKATDKDCVTELAYNKLLSRDSAATIEGLLISTIRIFITSHIVRSLATFSKFKIDFPNVFSGLYAAFIVEDMEKVLSGADSDSEERLSLFKDDEFWYSFLEQAVQTYARNVDLEIIQEPTQYVLDALLGLNDLQENFYYPNRMDLQAEKESGRIKQSKLLKNYRQESRLNSIYKTRKLAKKVLTQMVIDELNNMSSSLRTNLETIGLKPEIDDLASYLFSNFVYDSTIDISEENLIESSEELPSEAGLENLYTAGNEFSVYEVNDEESEYSKGDVYSGYYHTHEEDDGTLKYMAGDVHTQAAHNVLKPFSTKMIVPIGDCANHGDSIDSTTEMPFYLQKYTLIDGVRYSPNDAVELILENDNALNISDIYPGTMEVVRDEDNRAISLTGELGVRHGISFSIIINGETYELTSVEVDSLDTTIGQFIPLQGNSKLLLCLINLLKEDKIFKLVYRYIFPLNKFTSLAAIYNGMGFLPSIGEVTVANNDSFGAGSTSADQKPGMRAEFEQFENADGSTSVVGSSIGTDGWASYTDRQPGIIGGLFVTEWDSWDQELLQRTKKTIKRKFRRHYNSARLRPGQFDLPDVGEAFMNNLRANLKPAVGKPLLPWWKKSKFRNNPFDSKGNICEKE